MKLEIHKGLNGLTKIEAEWNNLFNSLSTPTYTQSSIWHKCYLQNLATDIQKCYYFCIYKNNSLIAIFPLEEARHKFYLLTLNTLKFSENNHFGLNSIIVDEDEDTQAVFEFLYQTLKNEGSIKWHLIYLERAIQNSQASLCKIKQSSLLSQSASNVCNILPIQDYEKTLEQFSKNFKGNLRKTRKKIKSLKKVEYESSNCTTLDAFFEHFLDIEASGWKGLAGKSSAIKLDPKLVNFYREVMHGFAKLGKMEINLMSLNDKPIAVQYSIILEPTVFLLKIGYDESCRKISPGNLLIEHKLKEYEKNPSLSNLNLISDAAWHTSWNPTILLAHDIYNCQNLPIAIYIKSILWLKENTRTLRFKLHLK